MGSAVAELDAAVLNSELIAITITIASLFIITLLQPVAPVLRQSLPPVPFFAQVFFVLRRKILPALIIAPNAIFLFGREIAPVIVGGRCLTCGQQQKQAKKPSYHLSHFHNVPQTV